MKPDKKKKTTLLPSFYAGQDKSTRPKYDRDGNIIPTGRKPAIRKDDLSKLSDIDRAELEINERLAYDMRAKGIGEPLPPGAKRPGER